MTSRLLSDQSDNITLDYHRQHPEISLERHFRSKFLAIADRVLARKRIYLDTRFWVLLRKVCLGRPDDPLHAQILTQLRLLVKASKVICPINATTLAELLKQNDPVTRLATAKLIDELSDGTALQSEEERVGTELKHCIQLTIRGSAALVPLERLVWTSTPYVLGSTTLMVESLPKDELLAWQKSFADYLWDVPLADQISRLPEIPAHLTEGWNVIAANLNRDIAKQDVKAKSFTVIREHEFKGALEVRLPKLTKMFVHLYGMGAPQSAQELGCAEKSARDLIQVLAEALRRDKLGRQLPSLVIRSGLYAALRRNPKRPLTGNDLHDVGHATAALAYCDYFATEKFLRHLVVNELKFDRQYDTIVIAEASEFLALLERL